jgi:hypothetical protein
MGNCCRKGGKKIDLISLALRKCITTLLSIPSSVVP